MEVPKPKESTSRNDCVSPKHKNAHKSSSTERREKKRSRKSKDATRSPSSRSHKKHKSVQSSNINTWLMKGSSSPQTDPRKSSSKKENDSSQNPNTSTASKAYVVKSKEKERSIHAKEHADRVNNNREKVTVKKKFKRIIEPSPSPTSSKRYEKCASPQTNTIFKWISGEGSKNFSLSGSSSKTDVDVSEKENSLGACNKYEETNPMPKRSCDCSNASMSDDKKRKTRRSSATTSDVKDESKEKDVSVSPSKGTTDSDAASKAKVSGTRRLYDIDLFSQRDNTSTSTWLRKDIATKKDTRSKRENKLDVKITPKRKRQVKNKPSKDSVRNYFKSKRPDESSSTPKFPRSESNESCELPSFVKTKKSKKKKKPSDSFEKYGMVVPSVEEILKEQKDLAQYQNQIESFATVDDQTFELPFSLDDLKNEDAVIDDNILGCKHLTPDDISKAFNDNLEYASDIFHGRKYSERHEKFYDAKNYTTTVKDLCYSTSTIVFSFEQKEQLVSMLKKEFDPSNRGTAYFFQVLLPELCLKIFMDTHGMTKDEAVRYLDTRPIIDD
ncbi:hypothetical protein NQ315_016803 [Exocentrus adspersus]|uniref:Uncharacterized protein n=1 Tax=Exocentrus adspersus TaxID=1586481 RepID=A0AAV8VX11_9CUCU|nr:hypothetical protein NQ315_016803 [Exocentrus adspersus]